MTYLKKQIKQTLIVFFVLGALINQAAAKTRTYNGCLKTGNAHSASATALSPTIMSDTPAVASLTGLACTCGSWGARKYKLSGCTGTYTTIPASNYQIPSLIPSGSIMGLNYQYNCSPAGCATAMIKYQLILSPSNIPVGLPVQTPSGVPYCFPVPCLPNIHNPYSQEYKMIVSPTCGGNYCPDDTLTFRSTACNYSFSCGTWNSNDSVTTILGGTSLKSVPSTNYTAINCVAGGAYFQAKYSYAGSSPLCVPLLTYRIYNCTGAAVGPAITKYSGMLTPSGAAGLITPTACGCYELRVSAKILNATGGADIICPAMATLKFDVCGGCGSWGVNTVTNASGTAQTIPGLMYTNNTPYTCNTAITAKYNYSCTTASCAAVLQYSWYKVLSGGALALQSGPTSHPSGAADVFTPTTAGNYVLKVYTYCGSTTTRCDSARYFFTVNCITACGCGTVDSIRLFLYPPALYHTHHCGDSSLWYVNSFLQPSMSCSGTCSASIVNYTIRDAISLAIVPGGSGSVASGTSILMPAGVASSGGTLRYIFTFTPVCNGVSCTPCTFTVRY